MSEKARFHAMTKPIRFRNLRRFVKSVGLTYEVGKEKIKYLISYILYKLNIYKRHTYNDIVVTDVTDSYLAYAKDVLKDPLAFHRVVSSDNICAHVKIVLEEHLLVCQDYFYVMRKGEKIRKHIVIDSTTSDFRMFGSLEHIGVRVSKEENYHFSNIPIYKIAKEPIPCVPFMGDIDAPLDKPVEVDVYEVDIQGLKKVRTGYTLPLEQVDILRNPHILKEYYDQCVEEFQDYADSLTFRDLLVNKNKHDKKVFDAVDGTKSPIL